MREFTAAGVDLDAVAAKLQSDGAESSDIAWKDLLAHVGG